MKKLSFLLLVVFSFAFMGCPENSAENPTFILTSPEDGNIFKVGDTINIDLLFLDESEFLQEVSLELFDMTNSKTLLDYQNAPTEVSVVDYKREWIAEVDAAPANLRMTFNATNINGQSRQGQISLTINP